MSRLDIVFGDSLKDRLKDQDPRGLSIGYWMDNCGICRNTIKHRAKVLGFEFIRRPGKDSLVPHAWHKTLMAQAEWIRSGMPMSEFRPDKEELEFELWKQEKLERAYKADPVKTRLEWLESIRI